MIGAEPPLLELHGVRRTFDPEHKTGIRDVSLSIYRGEFVAIVGPSGAGKSTLLNVLGLLDRADAGRYLVDGTDVEQLSEPERDRLRSRFFGFVFQSAFMLGDETSLQNAAMGLRIQGVPIRERTQWAHRALERLGMTGRAGSPARLLSGGERQRLAIARAIAAEPEVLLADEPTGNLDTENGARVMSYLEQLNAGGTTVIMITHDPALAAQAHRQITVVDGLVHERPASVPVRSRPVRATRPEARFRLRDQLGDDVGDALSALSHRKVRTLMLVLAFALGVGGLITSLGISESASAQVSERLTRAALDEVRVTVPGGGDLLRAGDPRLGGWIASIERLPHVRDVGYVAQVGASSAQIRRLSPGDGPPSQNYTLIAASPSYLALEGGGAVGASAPALGDAGFTNTALVGSGVRTGLGLPRPGPGASLWINGRRVSVIGQLNAGVRSPELTNTIVVSPDVIAGYPEVNVTVVVRTDLGYPATLANAIPLAMNPADPGQFSVETVADLRNLRYGVASDLGTFVGVLSAILLILASISAATTMYLTVQSRSQEIALRRAIGSSRTSIARLFVIEGLVIGTIGGVAGAVVGSAAAIIGAHGQGWTPVLPPELAPIGIGLGLLTGFVSALVPAWSASRHEPATAIRG
ncbi:MAG: macrolide transport system ATP-binding/permease protein [Actinomycetota bacterium]|nr:macrolide transport system ATP-binding/permease protein [Actinomycetota bacterium]